MSKKYSGQRYTGQNDYHDNYENTDAYYYDTGELYSDSTRGNQPRKPAARKNQKKKKKWSGGKIFLVTMSSILAVFLVLVGIAFAYVKLTLGQIDRVELPQSDEELGISSESAAKYKDANVTNIALFGVDSREDNNIGRSDTLMILSLDKKNNSIKLTSIARDSYVNVEGYGQTKINHAYAYEGPELAIKTINQNFDMDIRSFISVNFSQLAQIIDAAGGVTLSITEEERLVANEITNELNSLGIAAAPIPASGDAVHLTGGQAVAYARDRTNGGDLERNNRQKKVLAALFSSIKTLSVTEYPGFINMILSESTTSLSDGDMMSMGTWAITSGAGIEQIGIPNADCNAYGDTIDGVWYFIYDLSVATDIIHQFIYG